METLMKMKWKIGSVEIENPFILAPMAGVTDLPFRILCKEQGAGLLCTEMVSAKAISFHNKNTISLMQIDPVEHPVSMQIFGSEPDLMAEEWISCSLSGWNPDRSEIAGLTFSIFSTIIFLFLHSSMVAR